MVLWCQIFLLISAFTIGVPGQLDSHGFLSIDCGLPANSSYVDSETGLTYISDEQFIDTGIISNISNISFVNPDGPMKEFFTVRYFPTGNRNCYTLRSLTVGSKYLIRGTFFFFIPDDKAKPPIFDIYLGVNFWYTVNTSSPSYPEIIIMAGADYLEVCLVNTGHGTPYISSLHLRQLKGLFPYVYSTQSQILAWRYNVGESNLQLVRYPDDINDRWWYNYTSSGWVKMSTTSTVISDQYFKTPSLVMQTAATTLSTKEPLVLNWSSNDMSSKYYVILHFSEIQSSNVSRKFDVYANGHLMSLEYIPSFLSSYWINYTLTGFTNYNVSIIATSSSTLPPLLNAIELYTVAPVWVPTDAGDVAAINSIKVYYKIKKGWSGDPCLPAQFLWNGINCRTNSNVTRITVLKLSSSGLTGPLSDDFGNLTALVSLDLSSNNLSGSLPTSLDNLTALTYLDVSGNSQISTTLPIGLQKKLQDGSLEYRFGNIIPIPSARHHPKPIILAIAVVAPLLVMTVAIVTIIWWKMNKYKQSTAPNPNESYESDHVTNDQARNITQAENPNGKPPSKEAEEILSNTENRKFRYKDLKRITDSFKNKIGTGGFGNVYLGLLENGYQVAVKIRSQLSKQGVTEFMAEAENLARVHHKNLVSLVGYCIDKNCMALVYEYMQEGNLHDKLKDNERPFAWKQRLQIAYESALGLEHLHMACNPPLIHRDVKTSNILLNANLEAKLSDFGLSRTFSSDTSHISTRVVGTPGYVAPEYYSSFHVSAKSDVYSFGVVLLEIITGRPSIVVDLEEEGNLVQWVDKNLSSRDINGIADPRMEDIYDVNSVWKVIDLACMCTQHTSTKRPTMNSVVAVLKECLDLEMATEEMHIESRNKLVTDISDELS